MSGAEIASPDGGGGPRPAGLTLRNIMGPDPCQLPLDSREARMQASLFIARLLGPVFLVIGIALLTKPEAYRSLLREFVASAVSMYLAGFLGLVGGLALLLTHNLWVLDWRLVITLIGWISLLRGVTTILWPGSLAPVADWVLKHRSSFVVSAAIDLVVGLVLSYFGYSAA